MDKEYYIIIDGIQRGPMRLQELLGAGVKSDTLVWHEGLSEWTQASRVEELSSMFSETTDESQTPAWYAMLNGQQTGPATVEILISLGLTPQTPVWTPGMNDWTEARNIPEVMRHFSRNVPPPHFGSAPHRGWQGSQNSEQPYWSRQGHPTPPSLPFNWLPWAIVATVAGFLTSCIGAVFGIIAIVNANKANNYYRTGDNMLADQANSTAKTMTILGLIFAGIGLVFSGLLWSGSLGNLHLNTGWI